MSSKRPKRSVIDKHKECGWFRKCKPAANGISSTWRLSVKNKQRLPLATA